MTKYETFILENGDEVTMMNTLGSPAIVYRNGIIQSLGDYRIVHGRPIFSDDVLRWQSWFAWHPVRIKDKWYWLKRVYRRRKGAMFKRYDTWIYGDDFDVLKGIFRAPSLRPMPKRFKSFLLASMVLLNCSMVMPDFNAVLVMSCIPPENTAPTRLMSW